MNDHNFNLQRLLENVFYIDAPVKIGILIDLPDPAQAGNLRFLNDPTLTIQQIAHDVFWQGLRDLAVRDARFIPGQFAAYKITGGSNLDLPDEAWTTNGARISLEKDFYPHHDIILCISTFSATAPLTVFAKKYGFRGATLHGVNEIILSSGLSVDYRQVSIEAEKLRLAMTHADAFEIDFRYKDHIHTLRLETGRQDAQKSHGLCPPGHPDVANLPAGEVYFVPVSASGAFPMVYEEHRDTIGLMQVENGYITRAALLQGDAAVVDAHNRKLQDDPNTGLLGELGFGTQKLPVSGRDIQDEKILGTIHVATGRSDHLGGHVDSASFKDAGNATHDDILFAPFKTPDIHVPQVRMFKDGQVIVVQENFQPAAYLTNALAAD